MRVCPNCGNNKSTLLMTEGDFKIARCSVCALVFLLNIPDESEIYEDYYEIKFTKDDYRKDSPLDYLAEIYAINEQRMERLKKLKPQGLLLDIGCGSGLFLKTASETGYKTYGIDVSKNALRFAESQFGLDVGRKTLDELIAQENKFDIITLWHVLEHFANPAEELKKVKQLLNRGGICLIEVPNFNSIKFKLAKEKWKGGNHPLYHRSFFTSSTLRDTLRRSGFKNNERLKLSYKLPNKGALYNLSKDIFNLAAMDAFLDFAAKD